MQDEPGFLLQRATEEDVKARRADNDCASKAHAALARAYRNRLKRVATVSTMFGLRSRGGS
ncbi:MAG: hypothetical protein JWR10_966 [Rubritepida sp.]|nr:hypothetical protein [Rubritepida sp.]